MIERIVTDARFLPDINIYGCDRFKYDDYGRAVAGIQYQYQNSHGLYGDDLETNNNIDPGRDFGCEHPYAYGWAAAVYFLFVTIVGGLLLPTLLVALITACTDEASKMVERELRTLKAVRAETNRYPDFYSNQRVHHIKELFQYIDRDDDGSLTLSEVQPLMGIVDEVFINKPSAASQFFLVIDSDASGYCELAEFMHLFRNLHGVVRKTLDRAITEANSSKCAVNKGSGAPTGSSNDQKQPTSRPSSVGQAKVPLELRGLAAEVSQVEEASHVGLTTNSLGTGKIVDESQATAMSRLLSVGLLTKVMIADPVSCALILEPSVVATAEAAKSHTENEFRSANRYHQRTESTLEREAGSKQPTKTSVAQVRNMEKSVRLAQENTVCDATIREAVEKIFSEAALSVTKPLVMHRGESLDANLRQAQCMLQALRVVSRADVVSVVSTHGQRIKVNGIFYSEGRLLSPVSLEAAKESCMNALRRAKTRLAELEYLSEDQQRSGFSAAPPSEEMAVFSPHNIRIDNDGCVITELKPTAQRVLEEMDAEKLIAKVHQAHADVLPNYMDNSVESVHSPLQDGGDKFAGTDATMIMTKQRPTTTTAETFVREFGHDGVAVFAARAGWCVLAGEQQTRRYRRLEVADSGSLARRKVTERLIRLHSLQNSVSLIATTESKQRLRQLKQNKSKAATGLPPPESRNESPQTMSVLGLKAELARRSLPVSGLKPILQKRLEDAMLEEQRTAKISQKSQSFASGALKRAELAGEDTSAAATASFARKESFVAPHLEISNLALLFRSLVNEEPLPPPSEHRLRLIKNRWNYGKADASEMIDVVKEKEPTKTKSILDEMEDIEVDITTFGQNLTRLMGVDAYGRNSTKYLTPAEVQAVVLAVDADSNGSISLKVSVTCFP